MFRLALLTFLIQPANGAVSSFMQILFLNKGFSYSATGIILAVATFFQIVIPLGVSSYADKHCCERRILQLFPYISALLFLPSILVNNRFVGVACFVVGMGFFWSFTSIQDSFMTKSLGKNSASYGPIRAVGTLGYVIIMTVFALSGFPDSSNNTQIVWNMVFFNALAGLAAFYVKDYDKTQIDDSYKEKFSLNTLDSTFYLFMAIMFFSRITEGVIDKMLASYIKDELGLGNRFTMFVAIGAFAEFFVLIFGGRLFKKGKMTSQTSFILSCAGLCLRMIITASTGSVAVFAVAQTLHGLGFGACHLAATSYISKYVPKSHTSVAMTIYWSLTTTLAALIGTLLSGFAIDILGYGNMFYLFSIFPLISGLLAFCFRKRIGHLK